MSQVPERCPTCTTVVPEGAARCPGCGRVFGESNRCPHCHAIAAVIQRGPGTVCAACGKPRVGAVLLGGGRTGSIVPGAPEARTKSSAAMLARARGRGQRAFGVVALSGGILLAVGAAILIPGTLGLVVAGLGAVLGVGLGALSIRAGARSMETARTGEREAREAAVREVALAQGGVLTAAQLASALGWTVSDADARLTAMVGDGSMIDVRVDDEGVVRYAFRDLEGGPASRVRVDLGEAAEEEVEGPTGARLGKTAHADET